MPRSFTPGAAPAALAALVLSLPACCGVCERTRSSAVPTSKVFGAMSVTSDGAGADVRAEMRTGESFTSGFLELGDGDELSVSDGTTQTTLELQRGGLARYGAKLAGDVTGKRLTIAFRRPSDTSALTSSVTMPTGFRITSPASGSRISRGRDPLVVEWTPVSSDPMSFAVKGLCIEHFKGSLPPGVGRFELPTPKTTPHHGASPDCGVGIELTREHLGSIDPSYGLGGVIRARQVREAMFVSTP